VQESRLSQSSSKLEAYLAHKYTHFFKDTEASVVLPFSSSALLPYMFRLGYFSFSLHSLFVLQAKGSEILATIRAKFDTPPPFLDPNDKCKSSPFLSLFSV
jgi:hypothetical protein